MNLPDIIPLWWKVAAAAALASALLGAGALYHHHVYKQGVSFESARRDKIEADNSARAALELGRLNKQIAAVQGELNAARIRVTELTKDYDHEKAISADRKRALADGTERMRIRVVQRSPDQAGSPGGGTAGPTGAGGGSDTADIDPAVAANLEQLRVDHNSAIQAAGICAVQYDALKHAVDAMP